MRLFNYIIGQDHFRLIWRLETSCVQYNTLQNLHEGIIVLFGEKELALENVFQLRKYPVVQYNQIWRVYCIRSRIQKSNAYAFATAFLAVGTYTSFYLHTQDDAFSCFFYLFEYFIMYRCVSIHVYAMIVFPFSKKLINIFSKSLVINLQCLCLFFIEKGVNHLLFQLILVFWIVISVTRVS